MWKITILGDRHDGADKLHEEHFDVTCRRPPIRRPSSWTARRPAGRRGPRLTRGGAAFGPPRTADADGFRRPNRRQALDLTPWQVRLSARSTRPTTVRGLPAWCSAPAPGPSIGGVSPLLGAPDSSPSRLQDPRPPGQVVEHCVGHLLQMRQILERRLALHHGIEVAAADVHRMPDGRHLQLDRDQAQLLHGARAADAAIAHEGDRLAVVLAVGVVQGVLQHAGGPAIVFGRGHQVAVQLSHLRLPSPGLPMGRRPVGRRHRVGEEGKGVVLQVHDLEGRGRRAAPRARRSRPRPCRQTGSRGSIRR